MTTCIYPGQFQPFHNGHLMVVKGMMNAFGNATIVICETMPGDPQHHLFSAQQRREMISAALLEENITDANIVAVKDDGDDEAWARYVLDAAGNPSDALVWSGDESVRAIFEKLNIATKKIVPVPGILGSDIRAKILGHDASWKSKVPEAVAALVRI